jgi:hypothetical protein
MSRANKALQPTRLRILRGESPRDVSGPIRTASIADVEGGHDLCGARRYTSRLPYSLGCIGRRDRGGKHIRRPEAKQMTAASRRAPHESRCAESCEVPTLSSRGEGRCAVGRNGHVHHRDSRGRGPGIWRKIHRDHVGKVPMTSRGWSERQRPIHESPCIVDERHWDWHNRP